MQVWMWVAGVDVGGLVGGVCGAGRSGCVCRWSLREETETRVFAGADVGGVCGVGRAHYTLRSARLARAARNKLCAILGAELGEYGMIC